MGLVLVRLAGTYVGMGRYDVTWLGKLMFSTLQEDALREWFAAESWAKLTGEQRRGAGLLSSVKETELLKEMASGLV